MLSLCVSKDFGSYSAAIERHAILCATTDEGMMRSMLLLVDVFDDINVDHCNECSTEKKTLSLHYHRAKTEHQ